MTENAPELTLQQRRSPVDDVTLSQAKLYIDGFARTFASVQFSAEDVEDLAQNSWIKFWKTSPQEVISLKNYVRQLVYHEFVSMLRQHGRFLPLKTTDDGEYAYPQDDVLIEQSEWMDDPQELLLRQSDAQERMGQLMRAMRQLPRRQQFAMRCLLYQRVDDLMALVDAFRTYQVSGEVRWPAKRADKQRLQASCAPARAKIARCLNVDMSRW